MDKSLGILQLKTLKTKRDPVVTIGICVKNSEATVKEAIESILIQDVPHELVEVIFVDDGSTDKTLSIIKSYVQRMDMNVKVFHHEWKGLGASRNVVVDNASGDYIVWVDGDMVLSKDYVRKLKEFMEKHTEAGIAKGKQTLEPLGSLLAILEAYSRAASRMVDYQSKNAYSKALGTGGSIYRADMISQVGGFDENLRGYGEDWDFETRARAVGWSFFVVDVEFIDYERQGLTWSSLWRRYWLRGYYSHHFLHKNAGLIKHYRMSPPASFLAGIFHARTLFRLTRRKLVFLLPFQYVFKTVAWYFGFLKAI
jgi:glycosyltransferase involved in cell wall biosynthesis